MFLNKKDRKDKPVKKGLPSKKMAPPRKKNNGVVESKNKGEEDVVSKVVSEETKRPTPRTNKPKPPKSPKGINKSNPNPKTNPRTPPRRYEESGSTDEVNTASQETLLHEEPLTVNERNTVTASKGTPETPTNPLSSKGVKDKPNPVQNKSSSKGKGEGLGELGPLEPLKRSKFSSLLLNYLGINTSKMISELEVKQLKTSDIIKPHDVAYTEGFMSKKEFPKVQAFVDNVMFGKMGNDIVEGPITPTELTVVSPVAEETEVILIDSIEEKSQTLSDLDKPLFGIYEPTEGSSTEKADGDVDEVIDITELSDTAKPVEGSEETISLFGDEGNSETVTAEGGFTSTQEPVELFPTEAPQELDFTKEFTLETTSTGTSSDGLNTEVPVEILDEEMETEPIDPILLEDEGKSSLGAISLTDEDVEEEPQEKSVGKTGTVTTADETINISKQEESTEQSAHKPYFTVNEPDSQTLNLQSVDSDDILVVGSSSKTNVATLDSHTFANNAFDDLKVVREGSSDDFSVLTLKQESITQESDTAILEAINEEYQDEQIRKASSFIEALKIKKGDK